MKKIILKLITLYQNNVSQCMHYFNIRCKYYPSCSEYTKQAVEKYGAFKGSLLGMWRILRCNPLSKGGYDPLK